MTEKQRVGTEPGLLGQCPDENKALEMFKRRAGSHRNASKNVLSGIKKRMGRGEVSRGEGVLSVELFCFHQSLLPNYNTVLVLL